MKKYRTYSSEETQQIAAKLAGRIFEQKIGKAARVVALSGELGAGKTAFVQGFLRELGIRGRVSSPTFVLVKSYQVHKVHKVKNSNFTRVYHADFYRLHSAKQLEPLRFEEILRNPKNILLIEWPEKVKEGIPKDALKILFQHGKVENERMVSMKDL